MDMNSNPMLQRGAKKLFLFLLLWLILEIVCFIVVGYFIGGWNVFWIQFGTLILGYVIKPSKSASPPGMLGLGGSLPSGRGIASVLLMIPGFLSDIAALIVLIPPVRRLLTALAMKRMMPKNMDALLGQSMNNMFGQGLSPELLEKMAQQYNMQGQSQRPESKKKKKTKPPAETIDVDYEIKDGKKAEVRAEVLRKPDHQPKAIAEDIIDVNYKIEQ